VSKQVEALAILTLRWDKVEKERDQLRAEVAVSKERLRSEAADDYSSITQLQRELAAERANTADQGLTLACLCDGILGEDSADHSDQTLVRVGCRMKAELAAERANVRLLLEALENLCDEQNDAPLETRRDQWQAAMDKARSAIDAAIKEGAK
jgi:hypothetical protein